jgi:hypothetical protein
MAVAVVVNDGLAWWAEGDFHLLGLGDLWSHLDVGSLSDAQTAIQSHLSASLWTWVVRPLLAVPAVAAFLVLGLFFLWLGRRPGPAEPALLTGSRRPRRRRHRGGGLS